MVVFSKMVSLCIQILISSVIVVICVLFVIELCQINYLTQELS